MKLRALAALAACSMLVAACSADSESVTSSPASPASISARSESNAADVVDPAAASSTTVVTGVVAEVDDTTADDSEDLADGPTDGSTTPDTRTGAPDDIDADDTADDTVIDTADEAVIPEGFSTAMVQVTETDGTVCVVCVWLADNADERGRGLMGVTSLGSPEAMAFVWEQPTAGAFFMFQTVTALSIAWFGADEALVSTADMDPCLSTNSAECERFPAGGEFVLALEVFQGDLASIGITEGATARLVPGSEAADCPLD